MVFAVMFSQYRKTKAQKCRNTTQQTVCKSTFFYRFLDGKLNYAMLLMGCDDFKANYRPDKRSDEDKSP